MTDREKSILDKVITKFSAYRAKDIGMTEANHGIQEGKEKNERTRN